MVSRDALDSRHNECMQRSQICYSILLRYLRVLRCLHLPPKRHPGPNSPRIRGSILPFNHSLSPRAFCRLLVRSDRNEPTFSTLHSRLYQRLRHASHCNLLHWLRPHRKIARSRPHHSTYQQSLFPNHRPGLVHPLLGHQRWRCLHRHPLRHPPHHPLLLRPQRLLPHRPRYRIPTP